MKKIIRKIFSYIQGEVKFLFSKEIEDDIIAIALDVDELTDELEIDDDDLDISVIKGIAEKIELYW